MQRGSHQGHLLAHALAVAAQPDFVPALQAKPLEHLGDALAAERFGHPLDAPEEVKVVWRGHAIVEARHLRQEAHLGPYRVRVVGQQLGNIFSNVTLSLDP